MGRKPKVSYAHLMPTSAVQLDNEDGIQENKESSRVTKHKADVITQDREAPAANSSSDVFTMNEAMWSPYWTVAKALLRTQRNTFAYLEANRRLVDAMRTFARQEQKLALEISDMVLKAMCPHPACGRTKIQFHNVPTSTERLSEVWQGFGSLANFGLMRRCARSTCYVHIKTLHGEEIRHLPHHTPGQHVE